MVCSASERKWYGVVGCGVFGEWMEVVWRDGVWWVQRVDESSVVLLEVVFSASGWKWCGVVGCDVFGEWWKVVWCDVV